MRLWNELSLDIRQSASLYIFKSKLLQPLVRPVKFTEWLSFGDIYLSIIHTRLRLGSSQLNSHLFKIGVKDSAKCICGLGNEDTWHYFFVCPFYTIARSMLHTIVSGFVPFTLQTVLYGSSDCTLAENIKIFAAIQNFILTTERFKPTGIG